MALSIEYKRLASSELIDGSKSLQAKNDTEQCGEFLASSTPFPDARDLQDANGDFRQKRGQLLTDAEHLGRLKPANEIRT